MKNNANPGSKLGLVLIIMGVLFLLSKLEIFKFSFSILGYISALISIWPMVLIVVGISILLNKHTMIKMILWSFFLILVLLYSSYGERFQGFDGFHSFQGFEFFIENGQINSNWNSKGASKSISINNNNGAEKGAMNIDLGACKLEIGETSDDLVEIRSNMKELSYKSNYNNKEKTENIEIWEEDSSKEIKSRDTNLKLNEDIVWDINAHLAALDANLDLSQLKVSTFTLDLVAGNVDLFLGAENAHTDVYFNGAGSNINIHVPKESGVKIIKEGKLMNFEDKIGLKEKETDFVSLNYHEADAVVDVYLNASAANITVDNDWD